MAGQEKKHLFQLSNTLKFRIKASLCIQRNEIDSEIIGFLFINNYKIAAKLI